MKKYLFVFVLLILSLPLFGQSFYLDNPHDQPFQLMVRYQENGEIIERYDEIGPGEEHFLLGHSDNGELYVYMQSGLGHYLLGEDKWMSIEDSNIRFPFKRLTSMDGADVTYVIDSADFSYYTANFSLIYWDSDRVNIKADLKDMFPSAVLSLEEPDQLSYTFRGPLSYTVVDDSTGEYGFSTEDAALEHQYLLVDGKLKAAVYSYSFLNQTDFEEFFNRVFYNLDSVYPVADEDILTYPDSFYIKGYLGYLTIYGLWEPLTLYVVFIHPEFTEEDYELLEPYLLNLSTVSQELLAGE